MFGIINSSYDEKERVWTGVNRKTLYDFDASIGAIIHRNLRNYPKNVCQIRAEDGKTTTNQEMLGWATRLAQLFKQRGYTPETVIGIVARNSTYVSAAAVGCLFNATPFHAVNSTLDEETLKYVLGITKPTVIFCDASDYEKLKAACAEWTPELITLTGKVPGVTYVEDLLTPTKTELFYQPERLQKGGGQTVCILCSSGSTGKPKAVCMTNYMLVNNASFFTSDFVLYCGSSLDWYSGLVAFLYSVADGLTRVISEKPFNPEIFVELVQKYKITVATFSPRHVSALVACPEATTERLATIFVVAIGGGWIPAETLHKFKQILKHGYVGYGYGATEVGGMSAGLYNEKFGNTVGALVAGLRARIVDDNGKNLGPGEVGELHVNNGLKWGGYYGNTEEWKVLVDAEGWFHTGDLGYFDEHQNLYIVDRKKEIYKCLGMQYWPNDIEVAIAELPEVQEVCVVGIYDEKYGDAPAAMVVKLPGSSLTAEQIKEHVDKRMKVEFKRLHGGVYFVDDLPQTASGKVLRREVKAILTKGTLPR